MNMYIVSICTILNINFGNDLKDFNKLHLFVFVVVTNLGCKLFWMSRNLIEILYFNLSQQFQGS